MQTRASIKSQLLGQCQESFGALVLHVFDRGFAGGPWLEELGQATVRFVVRWPKHYKLSHSPLCALTGLPSLAGDERKVWQHLHGKRSWDHRLLPDARLGEKRKMGVIAMPVYHAAYHRGQKPLWLVASRRGQGKEPWYLLTNEPVEESESAWRVVLAYARRWQIEMSLRFHKSELAVESPRLWSWERRLKLLMLVSLAYAFLLLLLRLPRQWLEEVMRFWCHRTGKRSRETPTPLYRLRLALSGLFAQQPPDFTRYITKQSPG